jgi:PPK2 family polyphosphate:nucleotide phosphotransferase
MIRLKDYPTLPPEDMKKADCKKMQDELAERLGDLQHNLYAERRRSLLVIFQGMDASGKDGAIRKVFHYCSPSGVWAYPFKKPNTKESEHDFLWRVHQLAPRTGRIQIFNRSQYEDILVQWVHGWIDDERAEKRMRAINEFEQLLEFDNNTKVMKFYMHISKERQKKKLQERIDNPRKHWKHNPSDWDERKKWDRYMECYEYAINESKIPWHIVPVDKRWYRNYIITKILVDELTKMNITRPTLKLESP